MTTDCELLRKFAAEGDQAAFAELVRRHLDLVFAAALRQMRGDAHAAEDVTQHVFLRVAQKAPTLINHSCLIGWLYSATRLICLQELRSQHRRARRETEAQAMTNLSTNDPQWEHVQPLIDKAMTELSERERHSLLLRFFSQQDYRTVGEQLGLSDNAAQKLVARALERLNSVLSRQGITSTSAALALLLETTAVAAPTGLASTIVGSVSAAAVATGTSISLSSMILSKIVLALVAAAAGFGGGMLYQRETVMPPQAPAMAPAQSAPIDVGQLREQLVAAQKRAASVEDDNARLLDAIQRFKAATPPVVVTEPAPVPTAPVAMNNYIIQRGETVGSIAQNHGLTVDDLKAVNPEVNWSRLRVGQQIQLPAAP